jgi:hypothetical protein
MMEWPHLVAQAADDDIMLQRVIDMSSGDATTLISKISALRCSSVSGTCVPIRQVTN